MENEKRGKKKITLELDLSNYATKANLKKATTADSSGFVKNTDLAGFKSGFDRLDIDKLQTTPFDLSKLTNVVKKLVVKKTVYDELVKKVIGIDTICFKNLI